jgi:hypothetical protein
MRPPKCKLFGPAARYREKAVRGVWYDGLNLRVEIQGPGFSYARVTFEEPVGFRVLDERELCEFWNKHSQPKGWFYEVEEGGWMELESHRTTFPTPFCGDMREYMIVDYMCINVLCNSPPTIFDLGSDPSTVGN